MYEIDYDQTYSNVKKYLEDLTKVITTGCYEIKRVELSKITENTNLQDFVKIRFNTKYDEIIFHELDIISRLDVESKKIIYCVHLLNIKRKNLREDYQTEGYGFGDPFKLYKKALKEYGITQFKFIEYMD